MSSARLNTIYAQYQLDPGAHEAALLRAVTSRAVSYLQDEDEAQSFTIGVWQSLPVINTSSFSAWLRTRLHWHSIGAHRRQLQGHEVPATYVDFPPDEDGEEVGNDDKLAILVFQNESRIHDLPLPDLEAIPDPFIRKVARLLLADHTQDEAAEILGVEPAMLRQRLRRYRQAQAVSKSSASSQIPPQAA